MRATIPRLVFASEQKLILAQSKPISHSFNLVDLDSGERSTLPLPFKIHFLRFASSFARRDTLVIASKVNSVRDQRDFLETRLHQLPIAVVR